MTGIIVFNEETKKQMNNEYVRQAAIEKIAKEQFDKFNYTLLLSDFKVKRHFELVNGYHGWSREIWYPWYLFETDVGLIKIGWRKRVISVDWESTGIKWTRPIDPDVTAGETFFHAYSYDKLYEYMKLLRGALTKK